MTLFHHVGLITRDMDSTIARYELLGFRFTPLSTPRISLAPGRPSQPFGAGNRTAIFERNYLEILAHTDRDLWNSTTPAQRGPYDLDVPLARYEGMHVMHFGTEDIVALHDRLLAEGLALLERDDVHGADVTPVLLEHFHTASGGVSIDTNEALVLSNARLAAEVAVALA